MIGIEKETRTCGNGAGDTRKPLCTRLRFYFSTRRNEGQVREYSNSIGFGDKKGKKYHCHVFMPTRRLMGSLNLVLLQFYHVVGLQWLCLFIDLIKRHCFIVITGLKVNKHNRWFKNLIIYMIVTISERLLFICEMVVSCIINTWFLQVKVHKFCQCFMSILCHFHSLNHHSLL